MRKRSVPRNLSYLHLPNYTQNLFINLQELEQTVADMGRDRDALIEKMEVKHFELDDCCFSTLNFTFHCYSEHK